MKYAIVDLEATGAKKGSNRIIEVGIVFANESGVEETFQSLVNPESLVTPFVEKLTGITTSQLSKEPVFSQIAGVFFQKFSERIFVAHNVTFDYSLLHEELKRCGLKLELPRLCTLKLSRKAFPKLPSYTLSSVCTHIEVPLKSAHRALDDALGAYEILKKVIENQGEEFVLKQVTHKGVFGLKIQNVISKKRM